MKQKSFSREIPGKEFEESVKSRKVTGALVPSALSRCSW